MDEFNYLVHLITVNIMGNWHCVPNGCSKVTYKEYLPPKIRWRHEGEDWNEIEGDNFTLEEKEEELPRNKYVYWEATVTWDYRYGDDTLIREYTAHDLRFGSYNHTYIPLGKPLFDEAFVNNDRLIIIYEQEQPDGRIQKVGFNLYVSGSWRAIDWKFTLVCVVPNARQYGCDNAIPRAKECTFTVTLNGVTVHQETRDTCPEVEKIPCRLSETTKEIKIDKIPWLERVEVVDYFYDVRLGYLNDAAGDYGFLLTKGKIPDECLNIYKNNVTSTIPFDFGNIANTPENNYELIAQICSAPGCSRPEYLVDCDCKEECPEGTCEISCGDVLCCYDPETGRAVKTISRSNNGGD